MAIDNEDYIARIAAATPAGLVVINYELALDFIAEARRDAAYIDKAFAAVARLEQGLNMEIGLSQRLLSLYLYVNECLIKAKFGRDPAMAGAWLGKAEAVLLPLAESWRQAEREAGQQPVLDTPAVYAGLTYKNGALAEFVDENGRGYNV